jgi:predicted metal-dependent hydrolase
MTTPDPTPDRNPGEQPEIAAPRPRDEFGRPLPAGTPTRLQLADFDAHSVEENHRLGIDYFNSGVYFGAHEAWETAWKQTKGTEDHEFFKGLSQLGAGFTHYQRGNPVGAALLMWRGISRVRAYAPHHRDLDIEPLVAACERNIEILGPLPRDAGELPTIELPRL